MAVALGIDLGTTNSVAAIATPTGVEFILGARAERVHPSVVALPGIGGVVVGSDAKRYRLTEPQHVIHSAKRFIGQNIRAPMVALAMTGVRYKVVEGPNQQPIVVVRDRRLTMPEISSHVLLHLKKCAERQLGTPVSEAVLTVPANFTDGQRQATKEAGRLAGLEVLRLINEPTAAALAYGFGHERDQTIAVFDFGGGTFDVSILRLAGDIYEVLASDGDFFLGGDDLDRSLTELLASECNRILRFDPRPHPQMMMKLMMGAEAIKCHLSENDAAEGEIDGLDLPSGKAAQLPFQITRRQFEEMIGGYVQRTTDVTRQVLAAANLEARGVDEVLCVGGSTRIPLVRRKLAELFKRDPNVSINPDEVVAQGAAIQAGSLTNALTAGTGMGVAHSVATHSHSPLALEQTLLGAPLIPGTRASTQAGQPPTRAPAKPPATPTRTTAQGYPSQPGPTGVRAPGTPPSWPTQALDAPVKRPILLDVNPATLAIQTAGGFTERLLDKNSPIPIERLRVFTTARDNQTKVEIDCCRGEARRYAENEPLGTLILDSLPAKTRGDLKIEVSFRVDADGILHVRATDVDSGIRQDARLNVLGAPSADAKLEIAPPKGKP